MLCWEWRTVKYYVEEVIKWYWGTKIEYSINELSMGIKEVWILEGKLTLTIRIRNVFLLMSSVNSNTPT